MNAIQSNIYNNYITAYAPKQLTKFDTHKKSELRSIYNSIVKMNKESPWYLPTTSKDTQGYAVNLKENARNFHNLIASLDSKEENGLLNKKTAFSSDEEIASATFIGNYKPGDDIPSLSLEVKQLASAQENMGTFLSNSKAALPPDNYSFDIAVNNKNYELQFTVGESETNPELQARLARLINNASIGLNASVEESDGKTSLKITSDMTGISAGKSQIFKISDNHTSRSAGAVEYLGLDFISHQPSNAEFLLNGEAHSSSSNHFTVGNQFELNLHGITPDEQPITIGLKTDVDSLTDNVIHLANGYNSFVKAVAAYQESQPRSNRLVREMGGITSLYHNYLEPMGLTLKEDGVMNVDSDLLTQTASESEDVNETFGFLHDLSNMLLRKTNQISLNPMNYVDQTMVAYKNPKHNFPNPYVTSAYSGMLFNGYC